MGESTQLALVPGRARTRARLSPVRGAVIAAVFLLAGVGIGVVGTLALHHPSAKHPRARASGGPPGRPNIGVPDSQGPPVECTQRPVGGASSECFQYGHRVAPPEVNQTCKTPPSDGRIGLWHPMGPLDPAARVYICQGAE